MSDSPRLNRRTLLGAALAPAGAVALGLNPFTTPAHASESPLGAPTHTDGAVTADSTCPTGIVGGSGPVNILIFGGQSNAGPSPAGGISPPLLGPEYPCHAVTFAGTKGYAPGRLRVDPATLTALAPQDDRPWGAQMPGSTTTFALEAAHRAAGTISPGYLTFSAGEGGMPLEHLMRGAEATGHYSFVNTVAAANRAGPVLAQAGRTGVCRAYFFIHGENGPTAVSPPNLAVKRVVYREKLATYIDDVTAEIQAQLGQAFPPHFFLLQTNAPDFAVLPNYDPYAVGSVLAQLDVARARLGKGVTLVGPAYHTQLADNSHSNNLGRLIVGELLASAYRSVRDGGVFAPLWPTSARLAGKAVMLEFHLPGGRLQFDEDWVKPVPHHGFSYTDDAASATIESVQILGKDQVLILLDRVPTGHNPIIRYAYGGNESPLTQDHWTSARGQLYSDSGEPSLYAARGFAIPDTIRHYAVRFDAPLTPRHPGS